MAPRLPPRSRVVEFVVGNRKYAVFSYDQPESPLVKLSPAELDVVRLALGGATNQEIADRRGTSQRTVRNQLASVYEKLGVSSRAELAAVVAANEV